MDQKFHNDLIAELMAINMALVKTINRVATLSGDRRAFLEQALEKGLEDIGKTKLWSIPENDCEAVYEGARAVSGHFRRNLPLIFLRLFLRLMRLRRRVQHAPQVLVFFRFFFGLGGFAMPKIYASTSETLTQVDLPDDVLVSIGRLVRACAEIEDLVTLYICRLTGISQSHAVILLGRTMVSKRIEIASYLSNMIGPDIVDLTKRVFSPGMTEVFECRNAVAHGTLLGMTADKSYAFLTSQTLAPTGPSATQVAVVYQPEGIEILAQAAHTAIPDMIKALGLESLRNKRLGQALAPHRKGQSQQPGKQTPQPPPQP